MASNVALDIAKLWAPSNLRRAAPGIALCCAIAAVAFVANANHWMQFGRVFIPPLIVTLVVGMMLQPLSTKDVLKPGLEFAGRTLLRTGVALYGAQLTLGDLVHGGALPIVIAICAVGFTIVFGVIAARAMGLTRDFGFLTGCATGVCGAAAAMATSAVLPRHENSDRDLAFSVMGVNFISTVTMVVYPTCICGSATRPSRWVCSWAARSTTWPRSRAQARRSARSSSPSRSSPSCCASPACCRP